ncbi:unnamed protein product [Adineta ricciae]|uniref:Uncharacterized protein n=1 Tax=Adineta ricciae TaxID=249248 RepID=A0A815UUW2_ADIRI|nr:unnamed protein product [Adineta ricciae]CAF1520941.1 unnamed protein product [Adineta ricciae]
MWYLAYLILLQSISGVPQINLYYTDSTNGADHGLAMQRNCLHTVVFVEHSSIDQQIVFFCMEESLPEFPIETSNSLPTFTFYELSEKNITSEQLYLWSAPIDIIERYQLYLNENDDSMSNELFHNCTVPGFGPLCQYELEFYDSRFNFLHEMIDSFYNNQDYNPTDLTCYMHLQCYRGPAPACLDWTEICDGRVDCLDNGLDEQHCWQLEINACKDDEYRCLNGQCIPHSFAREKLESADCIDGTDELPIFVLPYGSCNSLEHGFRCEDTACSPKLFTSSCVLKREALLLQAHFSLQHPDVEDQCWFAFRCIISASYEYDQLICNHFCRLDKCTEIIQDFCPEMLFMPAIPIIDHRIYFAYAKTDAEILAQSKFRLPYVCYNDSYYNKFFIDGEKIPFKNLTCYRNLQQPIISTSPSSTNRFFFIDLQLLFWSYNLPVNYTSNVCDRSNMYQCMNSNKCISIHRVNNYIKDCPYGDDEKQSRANGSSLFSLLINWTMSEDNKLKLEKQFIENNVSFQTICDGYTELLPITIDGRNETDETECDQWRCNNIYTRCNLIKNCPNGEDEIGCDLTPSKHCSSSEQVCVSAETDELTCLPVKKINNGVIDCLGGTDESSQCAIKSPLAYETRFQCLNNANISSCLPIHFLCNRNIDCYDKEDERFCKSKEIVDKMSYYCKPTDIHLYSDAEKFFCKTVKKKTKKQIVYFALQTSRKPMNNQINGNRNLAVLSQINHQNENYCHRGLSARVWLNKKKNLLTKACFCPPNFYGNRCQYQNQRISVVVRFHALSDSWETPFVIVISLVDDSYERRVHSYEKITYLSMRDCTTKYEFYLTYSTRPKNLTNQYFIQFDIYEKLSLIYRGSIIHPINYLFLPVHRAAYVIDIPRSQNNIKTCSDRRCGGHGICYESVNHHESSQILCRCDRGWSGQLCAVPHQCTCSADSICVGVSADNRSICVCPIHKFGPRCLIPSVCLSSIDPVCKNKGLCIPIDEYNLSTQRFMCICRRGFSGERCEIEDNKVILSFESDIVLSELMFIHFITAAQDAPPIRATILQTFPVKQKSITIQWSRPFHLVFIEPSNHNFYLAVTQKHFNQSSVIATTIQSSDRCQHISEIFNQTLVDFHLLRRIKYYHVPCQNLQLNLSCFYDEEHLCLCYDHGEQRLANCFNFEHQKKFDCHGKSVCENGGHCFQDTPNCPQRSICACPPCFYGRLCQFSTSGFGLSLDSILSYHIQPNHSLIHQSKIVTISMIFTMILLIGGIINGTLSILTFKHKNLREMGCGLYLFGSAITALCTMIMFGFKFWILILAQALYITNHQFLLFQCYTSDFLLRVCLSMDQWLNACVAVERIVIARKGMTFDKRKSQQAAKIIIAMLLVTITCTSIHDPLNRRLIVEENDKNVEKRTWCIVTYSSNLQIFNSIVYTFHFFGSFVVNLICAVTLISKKTRRQSNLHNRRAFRQLLQQHVREHQHLFTAPLLLVVLALPRLIIGFISKCMKSANDSWLFLIGYFVSFIPPMLTFVIFIVPSKFYKRHFRASVAPRLTSEQRIRVHFPTLQGKDLELNG